MKMVQRCAILKKHRDFNERILYKIKILSIISVIFLILIFLWTENALNAFELVQKTVSGSEFSFKSVYPRFSLFMKHPNRQREKSYCQNGQVHCLA